MRTTVDDDGYTRDKAVMIVAHVFEPHLDRCDEQARSGAIEKAGLVLDALRSFGFEIAREI